MDVRLHVRRKLHGPVLVVLGRRHVRSFVVRDNDRRHSRSRICQCGQARYGGILGPRCRSCRICALLCVGACHIRCQTRIRLVASRVELKCERLRVRALVGLPADGEGWRSHIELPVVLARAEDELSVHDLRSVHAVRDLGVSTVLLVGRFH